ncbi:WD repeat-containing protein DWA1 [Platanthera guangdongensis]|uniref:WD repeat-containing protein DWA1 n=1 Tax=Platanthera guangdongensis TaxID=2320717 RepID=A0ABR2N4E7_9ASPA
MKNYNCFSPIIVILISLIRLSCYSFAAILLHSSRNQLTNSLRPLSRFGLRLTGGLIMEIGKLPSIEGGDARKWDEEGYRRSILLERELSSRIVFRTAFVPAENPNPEILLVASSDGLVSAYSISSCISHRPQIDLEIIQLLLNNDRAGCVSLYFFLKEISWKWVEVLIAADQGSTAASMSRSLRFRQKPIPRRWANQATFTPHLFDHLMQVMKLAFSYIEILYSPFIDLLLGCDKLLMFQKIYFNDCFVGCRWSLQPSVQFGSICTEEASHFLPPEHQWTYFWALKPKTMLLLFSSITSAISCIFYCHLFHQKS